MLNNTLPYNFKTDSLLEFFLCEGTHEYHKVKTLSEETKSNEVNAIIRKMIESIERRIGAIDTRDIDKSRGDLTKIPGYQDISKALIQLKGMTNVESPVDDLIALEKNILMSKSGFSKVYSDSDDLGIYCYRTVVMDLFYGTMVLISNSIDIAKERSGIVVRSNPKADLGEFYIFNNVKRFNELFRSGKIASFLESKPLQEMELLVGLGVAIVATFIVIFAIRESILFFFKIRKNISKEFKVVSKFLEINSTSVGDKKVAARQDELSKDLLKLADRIDLEKDITANMATKEVRQEINTEYREEGLKSPSVNKMESNLI